MGSHAAGDFGASGAERHARAVEEREEAKRRHPAGRALTGLFSQSHPWLAPPEPVERAEAAERGGLVEWVAPAQPGAALRRFDALEARLVELEVRVAALEGRDTVEVVTLADETPRVLPL